MPRQQLASYPIYVDPTYYAVNCTSSSPSLGAAEYLNDNGNCPYGLTFYWANDYWPVKAQVGRGGNGGFRKVKNRPDAGCSHADDSGPNFDFTVPCQMHDFGYDLIRVKNPFGYPNVTKNHVDTEFHTAMQESCFEGETANVIACLILASGYYGAVSIAPTPGKERPTGAWPSTEMLANQGFLNGLANWDLIGGTVSYSILDRPSFVEDILEFRCTTVVSCRIQQNHKMDPDAFGGERFSAATATRCNEDPPCDVRFKIIAKRHSDGGIETVHQDSWTVGAPWVIVETFFSLPQKRYSELQFLYYNDNLGVDVDVHIPSMDILEHY